MLVPRLRFKEFKEEWKKEKIGNNIYEIIEKTNDTIKYPLWSLTLEDGVTPKTERYERGFLVKKEDNFKIVHFNNFVYNPMNLRFGAIAYHKNNTDISVSGYYNIFSLNNSNTIGFWDNYFKSPIMIKRYNNIATGSLVEKKRVHYSQFTELIVPIPDIEEQIKISTLFVQLDKKIQLQKKRVEALKIYKKGLIYKLLNSIESHSWKNVRLKYILAEGSKVRVDDTSAYQKINIKLNLNGLSKNTSTREMSDTRPFYIRQLNEIIIGKQNYFNGSIAIVTQEFAGCICSNAIMSFSVIKDNPKYIYYYISQSDYIKKREFLANGTGQKELSEQEFLNFEIKLPNIERQNEIVNIIDSIDSKTNIELLKYKNLQQQKNGLLQQMFI